MTDKMSDVQNRGWATVEEYEYQAKEITRLKAEIQEAASIMIDSRDCMVEALARIATLEAEVERLKMEKHAALEACNAYLKKLKPDPPKPKPPQTKKVTE